MDTAGLSLEVHDFLSLSLSNGPGACAVLWTQGCTLGCPGCFNPQTHPLDAGKSIPVSDLLDQVLEAKAGIMGVTISGGEPFLQAKSLGAFCQGINQYSSLQVLIFSGFYFEEILADPQKASVLPWVDTLIAGRFLQQKRQANRLMGSSNKSIHHLTERSKIYDMIDVPSSEVLIDPSGFIQVSGIDPLSWE